MRCVEGSLSVPERIAPMSATTEDAITRGYALHGLFSDSVQTILTDARRRKRAIACDCEEPPRIVGLRRLAGGNMTLVRLPSSGRHAPTCVFYREPVQEPPLNHGAASSDLPAFTGELSTLTPVGRVSVLERVARAMMQRLRWHVRPPGGQQAISALGGLRGAITSLDTWSLAGRPLSEAMTAYLPGYKAHAARLRTGSDNGWVGLIVGLILGIEKTVGGGARLRGAKDTVVDVDTLESGSAQGGAGLAWISLEARGGDRFVRPGSAWVMPLDRNLGVFPAWDAVEAKRLGQVVQAADEAGWNLSLERDIAGVDSPILARNSKGAAVWLRVDGCHYVAAADNRTTLYIGEDVDAAVRNIGLLIGPR